MMKKIFLIGSLALGMLSTSCNNNNDDVNIAKKQTVSFVAVDENALRTNVREDLTVAWRSTDELAIMNKTLAATSFNSTIKFTTNATNAPSGLFSGEMTLEDNTTYVIRSLYPYSSYITSSGSTFQLKSNQSQTKSNPRSHIESLDALVGCDTIDYTSGSSVNVVSMKHLGTLMRLNIVNGESDSITISKVEFAVPTTHDIAGIFNVDFENKTFGTCTSSYGSSINLTIGSGGKIGAGDTLVAYMIMAPFKLTSEDLTITVTTDDNSVYTKTNNISKDFKQGEANSAIFKVDASKKASTTTFDFSAQGYDNAETLTSLTIDGITLTFAQNGASTPTKYYNTNTAARVYKKNTITVSGATVTNISFEFATSSYVGGLSSSVGTYTTSGKTGTWIGSSNSVVFTNNGDQARIQKIIITK